MPPIRTIQHIIQPRNTSQAQRATLPRHRRLDRATSIRRSPGRFVQACGGSCGAQLSGGGGGAVRSRSHSHRRSRTRARNRNIANSQQTSNPYEKHHANRKYPSLAQSRGARCARLKQRGTLGSSGAAQGHSVAKRLSGSMGTAVSLRGEQWRRSRFWSADTPRATLAATSASDPTV